MTRLAAAPFAFQSYTTLRDVSVSHAKNLCEDMWHGGKDTELGIKRFQLLLQLSTNKPLNLKIPVFLFFLSLITKIVGMVVN